MVKSPRNRVRLESGRKMGTTHIIISGILHSCDAKDKDQRHNGGEPGQGRDLRDQLKGRERGMSLSLPSASLTFAYFLSALTGCGSACGTTYLQNEKEQEVGVGDFLELLKEVDGQESEDIVLGGLDAVTLWPEETG